MNKFSEVIIFLGSGECGMDIAGTNHAKIERVNAQLFTMSQA